MVPNICQSRLHLIPTYVITLALFYLLFDVIAIISSVSYAGPQICIAEKDSCTHTTMFSNLTEFCNSAKNINALNLSQVDLKYILDIKLDFCMDALPLGFFFPRNKTSELMELSTNNSCNFFIPKTVSCDEIRYIQERDSIIQRYHNAYVDILERSEFNLEAHNETDTGLCRKAYKDWLCASTLLQYSFRNETLKGCESASDKVCLMCPSFKPEDTYGGFMAFQCNETKTKKKDDEDICRPQCISPESLIRLTNGNKELR